jgi:hypothetical protein
MISDEQFVERVRRWQPWRRPVGAFMLLIGIGVAGLSLYRVYGLRAESMAIFSEIKRIQNPSTQSANEATTAAEFTTAMALGFVLGTGLAAGMTFIFASFGMLRQSRKDRLLLQAWEGSSTGPQTGHAHGRA